MFAGFLLPNHKLTGTYLMTYKSYCSDNWLVYNISLQHRLTPQAISVKTISPYLLFILIGVFTSHWSRNSA